jgi:hypothetical protein
VLEDFKKILLKLIEKDEAEDEKLERQQKLMDNPELFLKQSAVWKKIRDMESMIESNKTKIKSLIEEVSSGNEMIDQKDLVIKNI